MVKTSEVDWFIDVAVKLLLDIVVAPAADAVVEVERVSAGPCEEAGIFVEEEVTYISVVDEVAEL